MRNPSSDRYRIWHIVALCLICMVLVACLEQNTPETVTPARTDILAEKTVETGARADVLSVEVTGEDHAYQFSVEIRSPDTGCDQYADWWEVLSEDGTLIYRRILTHSHTDEQPFIRSGGPVNISNTTVVIVRAHMQPGGYGGIAMIGSEVYGFDAADIPEDFASNVMSEDPLPDGCAF